LAQQALYIGLIATIIQYVCSTAKVFLSYRSRVKFKRSLINTENTTILLYIMTINITKLYLMFLVIICSLVIVKWSENLHLYTHFRLMDAHHLLMGGT